MITIVSIIIKMIIINARIELIIIMMAVEA